jgi:uncharacterized membrane protein YcaP (DUF421 family)
VMGAQSSSFDWHRVFVGDVPADFLLELVMRMSLVYLIIMISMRLLGKRMAAQLTRNEMAGVTSLAAAVGLPVVAPDRGLLPAVVISAIVVMVTKIIAVLSARNEKTEALTQGKCTTLIKDGVMDIHNLEATGTTRERVLGQLRSKRIRHLGEVKQLFFEANGNFSLIRSSSPGVGLCALPDEDTAFISELHRSPERVCRVCGNSEKRNRGEVQCRNCGREAWVTAVT